MVINIVPINDIKEHIENSTCSCNPKVEFHNGEMMIIHNSFDGREKVEKLINDVNKN